MTVLLGETQGGETVGAPCACVSACGEELMDNPKLVVLSGERQGGAHLIVSGIDIGACSKQSLDNFGSPDDHVDHAAAFVTGRS